MRAMTLRLPVEVHEALRREAFESRRSMNEIINDAIYEFQRQAFVPSEDAALMDGLRHPRLAELVRASGASVAPRREGNVMGLRTHVDRINKVAATAFEGEHMSTPDYTHRVTVWTDEDGMRAVDQFVHDMEPGATYQIEEA